MCVNALSGRDDGCLKQGSGQQGNGGWDGQTTCRLQEEGEFTNVAHHSCMASLHLCFPRIIEMRQAEVYIIVWTTLASPIAWASPTTLYRGV